MNKLIKALSLLSLGVISLSSLASGGGTAIPNDELPSYTNQKLAVSMQMGMKIYMNNCMGCHSLAFQRYNRAAKDLGISEQLVLDNLMFTGEKIGDLMINNMPKDIAESWFGTAPPDLSLVARSRGTKWLYNYFRGFYKDDSRPYGVNNSVFMDVGMPHALGRLQGLQDKTDKVKGLENDIAYSLGDIVTARDSLKNGGNSGELNDIIDAAEHTIHETEMELAELSKAGEYFTLIREGTLSPADFDLAMTDLVYFLDYVGEPIKRERKAMGIYVIMFLVFFTFVAYLLKKEYWKDVH